ncbi:unnamed protein product [Protopolystoma xenopodis]|uniref:Uncharacterized protein n=1 Tax=Protopolystoma xenopodis TaxID=117903 RepID=A0A3S4ZQU0_9PLAT|nr:unnamed protein product [Protopolystoma xenopodis]
MSDSGSEFPNAEDWVIQDFRLTTHYHKLLAGLQSGLTQDCCLIHCQAFDSTCSSALKSLIAAASASPNNHSSRQTSDLNVGLETPKSKMSERPGRACAESPFGPEATWSNELAHSRCLITREV